MVIKVIATGMNVTCAQAISRILAKLQQHIAIAETQRAVSYTHLTLPTTPYV